MVRKVPAVYNNNVSKNIKILKEEKQKTLVKCVQFIINAQQQIIIIIIIKIEIMYVYN